MRLDSMVGGVTDESTTTGCLVGVVEEASNILGARKRGPVPTVGPAVWV